MKYFICAACAFFCIMLGGCRKPASDVDVDLTALSATMVYSEVFNMVYEPEGYVGKTVRMDGVCAKYHNQLNDTDYYACIIEDATACCSQGLEFVLTDAYKMPDDYPPDGKEIELQGTFEIFEEDGYEFCRITEARLL